jgi:tetratricopeptide (TPR) repeat protein
VFNAITIFLDMVRTMLIIIILLFRVIAANSQTTDTSNETGIKFFIEGKSSELKEDYKNALENYRTALKYEQAGGIYFAIANIYVKTGKFQDALIEINNALKFNPGSLEYLTLKANIYYGTGKIDKAVEIYENILAKDSENVYILYSLARSYQELHHPESAVIIYEKIIDVYGFDQDVLKRMFEIYSGYKDYEKAAEVLNYSLKLDPYNNGLLLELASLYSKLGKEDDAKSIYERLSALNPDDKLIQAEIVKLYFRKNQIDKGFAEFAKILGKDSLNLQEKIQLGEMYYNMMLQDGKTADIVEHIFGYLIDRYPENWAPYYYLGEIDITNKKNDDAYKKFMKGSVLVDTSKEGCLQFGYALFTLEKYEDSKSILLKGLSMDPDDFRTNYTLALTLQRLNDLQNAIKHYEHALKFNPTDLSIISSLALAYNSNKQYIESNNMYEKALMVDPENALLLNNYAYNLSTRGENLDKALDMSKHAVNKEPGNPSYLDTFGWIYYMMKDYKSALEYIERAVSINGSNAVLLDHLGDTHFALKDVKKALYFWQKALELSPNNIQLEKKIKENE